MTGAGGPAGVAVIRRLLALGHRVIGADSEWAAAGGALAHVGVTVPRADHPRFLEALLGIAAAQRVDALISTVAEELPALAAGASRLTDAGVGTWLPSVESVDLCCDKAAFALRLADAGVEHPATTNDVAGITRVPGPWIVKPRWGRGSRGVRAVEDVGQVVDSLRAGSDMIVQSRLVGREFTADALVSRDGRLLTVVPRWREETKAGISVKGTTFDSAQVTAPGGRRPGGCAAHGSGQRAGFCRRGRPRHRRGDQPSLLGGLPLTLAAGADVVAAYLAGIREPDKELPMLWFTPGVRVDSAETYSHADGSPVADPCAAAMASA